MCGIVCSFILIASAPLTSALEVLPAPREIEVAPRARVLKSRKPAEINPTPRFWVSQQVFEKYVKPTFGTSERSEPLPKMSKETEKRIDAMVRQAEREQEERSRKAEFVVLGVVIAVIASIVRVVFGRSSEVRDHVADSNPRYLESKTQAKEYPEWIEGDARADRSETGK